MNNIRKNCVICNSKNLVDFLTIDEMPVYMGISKDIQRNTSEMIFCECLDCKNIQLRKLIDIEILYSHNHNIDIVGELWKKHYLSFVEFMSDDLTNKTILEIGDPSAKIAKIINSYNKWIIVEKNPNISSSDKIHFIEKFFDNEFKIDENIDVIVHSHLFEHIYNPISFLKKCNEVLNIGGNMYFSIPDMKYLLEGDFLPNSILHFEHTYFIDEVFVKKLAILTGFNINKTYRYNNHSVFFNLTKISNDLNKQDDNIEHNNISDRFLELYDNLKKSIFNLNKIISNYDNIFIYGAHVTTQSYIFNGLDTTKFLGVIDGSESKIGNYLHSTKLMTYNSSITTKYTNVAVICSHMGIYMNEISEKLKSINPNVIIL